MKHKKGCPVREEFEAMDDDQRWNFVQKIAIAITRSMIKSGEDSGLSGLDMQFIMITMMPGRDGAHVALTSSLDSQEHITHVLDRLLKERDNYIYKGTSPVDPNDGSHTTH